MRAEQCRRVAMVREMLASGEWEELREAHNWLRSEFAAMAAVPYQALGRWERGESRPNVQCALVLWRAMAKLQVKPRVRSRSAAQR